MMPASEQGTSRRLHLNVERRVLQVVEEEDEEGGRGVMSRELNQVRFLSFLETGQPRCSPLGSTRSSDLDELRRVLLWRDRADGCLLHPDRDAENVKSGCRRLLSSTSLSIIVPRKLMSYLNIDYAAPRRAIFCVA